MRCAHPVLVACGNYTIWHIIIAIVATSYAIWISSPHSLVPSLTSLHFFDWFRAIWGPPSAWKWWNLEYASGASRGARGDSSTHTICNGLDVFLNHGIFCPHAFVYRSVKSIPSSSLLFLDSCWDMVRSVSSPSLYYAHISSTSPLFSALPTLIFPYLSLFCPQHLFPGHTLESPFFWRNTLVWWPHQWARIHTQPCI